jgi:hypothetical protein
MNVNVRGAGEKSIPDQGRAIGDPGSGRALGVDTSSGRLGPGDDGRRHAN